MSTLNDKGFLTLNQSLLVVLVSAVVVIICFIAIIAMSIQFSKVSKILKKLTEKTNYKEATSFNQSGINTPVQWTEKENTKIGRNKRFSIIPRPQLDTSKNPYLATVANAYALNKEYPENISRDDYGEARDQTQGNGSLAKGNFNEELASELGKLKKCRRESFPETLDSSNLQFSVNSNLQLLPEKNTAKTLNVDGRKTPP